MLKKRKHISELEVQYFIVQVIEGLKYLHHNKVIHREYIFYIIKFKIGKFND